MSDQLAILKLQYKIPKCLHLRNIPSKFHPKYPIYIIRQHFERAILLQVIEFYSFLREIAENDIETDAVKDQVVENDLFPLPFTRLWKKIRAKYNLLRTFLPQSSQAAYDRIRLLECSLQLNVEWDVELLPLAQVCILLADVAKQVDVLKRVLDDSLELEAVRAVLEAVPSLVVQLYFVVVFHRVFF